MDETTCPKRGCKELRKGYSKLAAENAQLQKSLASVGKISEQESASEAKLCEQNGIDVSCSVLIMQYNSYCILHACTLCHYLDAMRND